LRNFAYALSAQADKARAWYRECLFLLTIAGVVFRAEIAMLVFSICAFLIGIKPSSITSIIIPAGLLGAASGLLATVVVDSYFWQSFPSWPELEGFYYNTILGKSSEWGVSPPGYYFTNALPKLMLNPITYVLLIPIAVAQRATRVRSIALLLPSLTFVGVYSALPHKEWRFIIYVIPVFTVVASVGASWIWTRRSKGIIYRILAAVLLLSTAASFLASAGLSAISRLNYPGGEAVMRLHELTSDSPNKIHVHADNLACQTGLTRFLEDRTNLTASGAPRWVFDKTDEPQKLLDPTFWDQFDYVIAESPERTIGKFEVIDVVRGYAGITVKKPGQMLDDRAFEERFIGGRTIPLESWEERWFELGSWARGRFTWGCWPVVRMEPKLRILKKQKSPVNTHVEEV
jgi:alpha-1,6-mannosyltransferase